MALRSARCGPESLQRNPSYPSVAFEIISRQHHPAEDNPKGLPAKTVVDGSLVFNPASEWTAGGFPGYRSRIVYFPELGVAVAIQVNTDIDVDLGHYALQMAKALLGVSD